MINLSRYDAVILDLWGVVHDGTALYPHALESIQTLRQAGKKIVLLSNAPRQAHKAREVLDRLGVAPALYDLLLTSGQAAHDRLAGDTGWLGTQYYYLGPGKDEDILSDLAPYTKTDAAHAQFVLNTGFEFDFQPQDEILPTLGALRARNLPLLCVNPDFEVVKLDGTQLMCAGVVAAMYEQMGGIVHRIGKPHPMVYQRVLEFLGIPASRILAIGDGPATDVLGANRAHIDSVLITGGILSVMHPGIDKIKARAVCAEVGAEPTYVMESFRFDA